MHTPLVPCGSSFSPHAFVLETVRYISTHPMRNLHKRIVDGDDKHLSRVLDLWVVDESRNMGVCAARA